MVKAFLKKLKQMPTKQLLMVVIVVIAFFFLLNINTRVSNLFTKRQAVQAAKTEVVALYATDVALQTQLASVQSEEEVEEFSRLNGYIQPEDIPVAVVGTEGELEVPSAAVLIEANPSPYENWELWYYLIFGKLAK